MTEFEIKTSKKKNGFFYSILLFFKFIICCFRKKEETKRYNTYASEKAKGFIPPENVISEGNVDSIIPVKGKSYLITAGGWDNERENHATNFSIKYPNSKFFPMTSEQEGNLIRESIKPFLLSLGVNQTISIICSGKSTIHFSIVHIDTSKEKVSPVFIKKLPTSSLCDIESTVKSMKSDIFFLGGLFSVAGKKTYPEINDNKYIECTKEHYMNKIHCHNGESFLHIKEYLGTMMNEVLNNLDDSVKIIVGGR